MVYLGRCNSLHLCSLQHDCRIANCSDKEICEGTRIEEMRKKFLFTSIVGPLR